MIRFAPVNKDVELKTCDEFRGIGIAAILCVFTAGTVRKQRMSESLPLEVDSVQLLFSVPLKQY